ncbi:MAG: hypothetical protein FJ271_13165 [Planctomycetes bacterium]|nr:hypothetical protein [Planctomycetota bacterium]
MSALRPLKSKILVEGEDGRIDEHDLATIQAALPPGPVADDDMKVLIEMRGDARSACPAFDAWFFPMFKEYLLADGQISSMEQYQILHMLYGGGGIDPAEKAFLQDLRQELAKLGGLTPQFEQLFQQAMRDA